MNEKNFLQTMIDTLMYDSLFKDVQEHILPIVQRSEILLLPQWEFVKRSGFSEQRYENVEIRVPVPLIDKANDHIEDIKSLISYVYQETEYHALGAVLIRPKIIHLDNELVEHDVHFSRIQNVLIQGIRDAKYLIWAAVAWFTNEAIYNELLIKKQQGLDIRLIISDEPTNEGLRSRLEKNFDLVVMPRHGWNDYNRMHDKFCIVDLTYVMHGSYNWTPTANYNEETLATAIDKSFVCKFADEFMRIYLDGKNGDLI